MKYCKLAVKDFNLDYTLSSGQVFNWEYKDDFWYGVIGNGVFKIKQQNNKLLFISNLPKKSARQYIKRYFNLDVNLSKILKRIDKDKFIHKTIATFKGLRVVNMPAWECAVSYILSINTNIPRIKKMIRSLCLRYGKKIYIIDDFSGYTFPTPDKIVKAGLPNLQNLKLGFRAKFLFELAKVIKEKKNFLEYLKKDDYDSAKRNLDNMFGIGPKVADCVLLYGCRKNCAFPIDVWIRRAVKRFYQDKIKKMFSLSKNDDIKDKTIEEFAKHNFGRYAGWAQAYLYCYVRKELKQ